MGKLCQLLAWAPRVFTLRMFMLLTLTAIMAVILWRFAVERTIWQVNLADAAASYVALALAVLRRASRQADTLGFLHKYGLAVDFFIGELLVVSAWIWLGLGAAVGAEVAGVGIYSVTSVIWLWLKPEL